MNMTSVEFVLVFWCVRRKRCATGDMIAPPRRELLLPARVHGMYPTAIKMARRHATNVTVK